METFGAMSSVLQILAMRNPRRLVLAGCVSASIVTTILSATLGWAAPDLISRQWTHHITTLLFFGFGLWFLWYGFKQGGGLLLHQILMSSEGEIVRVYTLLAGGAQKHHFLFILKQKKKKQKRPFFTRFFSPIFLKAFLFTFFAEFGDKSLVSALTYLIGCSLNDSHAQPLLLLFLAFLSRAEDDDEEPLKKSRLIRFADPGAEIGSHDLSPTETGKYFIDENEKA
ncbi:hypothetical protein YC2023_044223 [Brassica napus]